MTEQTQPGPAMWPEDRILRADVRPGEMVEVKMGRTATVVEVAMRQGVVNIWWIEPRDSLQVTRRFITIGTGWHVDGYGTYLGTAHDGVLVWHVIEMRL